MRGAGDRIVGMGENREKKRKESSRDLEPQEGDFMDTG